MDDQNRKLEENRTRYGFAWWRQIRQGIGFSATLPTPFAQRVSSPWNAFTRSLAYHASGGARRVESSANNNPFWPVGWLLSSVLHTPSSILYYNSHSAFLRMARLFVCPMVGQLKAFRRFVDAIFFPSPPPLPSLLAPLLLRLRKSRDPWDWRGPSCTTDLVLVHLFCRLGVDANVCPSFEYISTIVRWYLASRDE